MFKMDYIYIFKDVDEHGGRQRDVFGPSVDVASSDEVWFTHEDYLQRYARQRLDGLTDGVKRHIAAPMDFALF